MRLLSALILILAIVGALGSKTFYQPKLNPTLTLKDKLQQSHLGNALLNMVQVGNKSDADFDSLFEALKLLKESLVNKREAENEDYNSDGELHRKESSRLRRLINQYNNAAILFQDELDALVAEGLELQGNLKNQNRQLKNAEEQRNSEQQFLKRLGEETELQAADYQNAINLLQEAMQKLEQAQQQKAFGVGSNSQFIETNKESFVELGSKIEKQLSKIKTNTPQFIQPLSKFLVQMSTSEPDVKALDRAIEALENLRNYYMKGLSALQAQYQAQVEEHSNLLSAINVQLGNLSQVVIPKTKADIEANSDAQQVRQDLLTEASRNFRIESKNLEDENESWGKRVEMHNLLIPQINSEYEIVEQAESMLQQYV